MDFIKFCEAHGLIMGSLIEGRWVRVRTEDKKTKRNGAYKYMGDHGFVQNHATMTSVVPWRPDSTADIKPVDEQKARARREADREYRRRAIQSARQYWADSRPLSRIHPYVERKGLTPLGCAGLRQNDGMLVVPVYFGDALISVQTIHPDGTKRFFAGAPIKGGAYTLSRPRSALTVFVEGLATGLAVYQSMRQATVVCAFNSGNLLAVAEKLRPRGSVVIAADHDHQTLAKRGFNPGIESANNVAELYGYGVAAPQGISGTDWCDYLAEVGEGAAKRLERAVLAKARLVMT